MRTSASGASETSGGGGTRITKAGRYHVACESAVEKEDHALLKLTVLAGDHSDQVGKEVTDYLNFFPSNPNNENSVRGTKNRIFGYAVAFGLTERIRDVPFTDELRKQVVASGEDVEFDFSEAEGRQAVVGVDMQPAYKDESTDKWVRCYKDQDAEDAKAAGHQVIGLPSIGFDINDPLSDKVKSVPKDQAMLGLLGGSSSGEGNGRQPVAASATTDSEEGDWGF